MVFYQNILDTFAKETGVEFKPFPVVDSNVKVFKFYKRSDGNDEIFDASCQSMHVLKIDSELQTIYAGLLVLRRTVTLI